jgi:hypothetical protein
VRKSVATIPNPPNVDMTRKPIEEQLAQVLEAILRIDPENTDLSNFSFELLITYTFMATLKFCLLE